MNRGRLPRAFAAAAVMISGTAVVTWAAGRGDTARAATAVSRVVLAKTVSRVVLDDGFPGERGDGPDGDVWSVEGGQRAVARIDGEGGLVLGSVLRTKKTFGQEYGRAEARIKMWRGEGAWRALGVLDAAGRVPAGTVEYLGSDRVDGDDFHTYTLDWTPTTLTWSLDGRQVLRHTPEKKGQPLALVLNLAAGGRYPSGMLVDRVKVTVQVPAPAKPASQWKAFITYKVGQLVGYDGTVYRVREQHTSLPGWQPSLVPALFSKV